MSTSAIQTNMSFDELSQSEKLIAYVTHFRLSLYNQGLSCGPRAIHEKLRQEAIRPVPSTSTIARVLRNQHLTNGRTGYYEEDDQQRNTNEGPD